MEQLLTVGDGARKLIQLCLVIVVLVSLMLTGALSPVELREWLMGWLTGWKMRF